jgi:phosphate/sulfate permease
MGTSVWVTTVTTFGLTTIASVVACPLLYRRLKMRNSGSPQTQTQTQEEGTTLDVVTVVTVVEVPSPPLTPTPLSPQSPPEVEPVTRVGKYLVKCREILFKVKKCIFYGVSVDIHESITTDKSIELMHSRAEKFDPQVEYIFSWLQVFSAICVIFAHGANEVGYMAGPLTTIYDIYMTGQLTGKVTPNIWIILISAVGLVIGLATYGYHITRAMGTKLAMLSPSRGFCAELSTALVIMVTSQMGLPVSSSLSVIGGIMGVGLLEGWKTGVNWILFAKQLGSWIMTMVICSVTTAGLFAQGVYSPSKL